ncbi:hypothetical protein A2774_05090 [Candidatus Roizmanbacteria bacterium RIFCSPHIGHO2_01_FULL_39_12c]|uniref:Helix-turn-helix type 11 domain-containing protein n=1 Tax=Candidatus Roizmanbacteria bacterium RIFCSPHIGHO2_01_FULL_39_12c TaxID=1802031 RepID=A0A1F7G9D2_9BACT|nr:MAG: hypothetical protein A2774_05090 [Candidatus Roizmanbacteria bacterium RIFCSPHIGHO2_01_FULL_39_12c]OGK46508.1 MAG: hypothetical protein A2963_01950 [Candidatus Roizmanbacteria bacterium RIFCSPLOWO2_01_FULL_40_13]
MITNTSSRIIKFISANKKARVHDLVGFLKISTVAVHKQMQKLLREGKVERVGKPPLVFYQLTKVKKEVQIKTILSQERQKEIENNYLYISPVGELIYGFEGFKRWVISTKQEKQMSFLAREYVKYRKKLYKSFSKGGNISALKKLKDTFTKVWIDDIFYLDFYSLPKFGKTKLGQLVLYAKQSQNLSLVEKIVKIAINPLRHLIKQKKIDAISFIPHTIPRKIQFLKEFERLTNLEWPKITIVKAYKNNIFVAQKSLAKLEDRIINARDTIFITSEIRTFKNVLLIDDAAGSGASMTGTW